MADTLESLRRRKDSAAELGSVVRTMKAIAAANIGQYEAAVTSLRDYYRTMGLSIYACIANQHGNLFVVPDNKPDIDKTVLIVFGSDQGLVGRFNDTLADFVEQKLPEKKTDTAVWIVGERISLSLNAKNFTASKVFSVPNSVDGITPLVNEILGKIEEVREMQQLNRLYLFYNSPVSEVGYEQKVLQLLPIDRQWKNTIDITSWPTKTRAEVIGGNKKILPVLIKEFLFMSLYKATAESLACENRSRLEAMRRAEKNISEMLENFSSAYNHLRQMGIDEELFDVVAGSEALMNSNY